MNFKWRHFQSDIILTCIRWYLAYPLSYRNIEEMMLERGIDVDHTTINRWVLKYTPEIEKKFRKHKGPVGTSWRLDETYIKVKGQWKYLYRAVDSQGLTIDFMLSAKRDTKAAKKFFKKAIKNNETPATVNINKSGANNAGIKAYNRDFLYKVKIRQSKYLNNIVESDHRKIKTITNPMKGFQSFKTARIVLAGIEVLSMIRKNQLNYMAYPPIRRLRFRQKFSGCFLSTSKLEIIF